MSSETRRPRILIVEDSTLILRSLADCLEERYEVATAATGGEALAQIGLEAPDLVLLDIVLPDFSGYEVFARLKANARSREVPVIFVTSVEDPVEKAKAFALGAMDYLTKPVQLIELQARVALHLNLREARVALARQNMLLEEMVHRRTEKLQQVLRISLLLNSELDIDRMFQRVVTEVSHVLECERTTLYLLDAAKQTLWTKAAEGIEQSFAIPVGRGLVGKAAAMGQPFLVEDAYADPDFDGSWDRKHGYHTRSVLCYPITNRKDELTGILQAINKREGIFGKEEEELAAALAAQIGVALETVELVNELRSAFESFARTLSRAVEAKHPLTAGHAVRVTEYSLLLARQLGLASADLEVLKYAGLLHDIGKIGVPDRVLTKQGQFDAEERALMNDHAMWTNRILSEIRLPRSLGEVPWVATCHHERVDGTGYPAGLRGEAIPLLSKIIAVGDVFDALTSRRDYPKYESGRVYTLDPLTLAKAFGILDRDQGTHFDRQVVAAAFAAREELASLCARLAVSQA